jgi:hypothetical protein
MKMYLCVLLTLLVSVYAYAQPAGGDFVITSSTIDGGGARSSGGDFSLTGTIGQHDASIQSSAGGSFLLAGGFWARGTKALDLLFKDGFESE